MYVQLLVLVSILHQGQSIKYPSVLRVRPLYVRVHQAKFCDDLKDAKGDDFNIQYEGTKVLASGSFIFYRDIEKIEKEIVIIRRCNDAAEDRNCEPFQTWRFGREACHMLEQKHAMWTSLLEAVHPNPKCPLIKGVYRVNNATFDAQTIQQVLSGIPLEKYFWRVRTEGYDHNNMFMCVDMAIYFLRGKH